MNIISFRYFAIAALILLIFSCQPKEQPKDFVYIDNKQFAVNQERFFPLMINYIGLIREFEKGEFSLSPAMDYDSLDVFEAKTPSESIDRVRAHFALIKELGFNSVRLAGLDLFHIGESDQKIYFTTIDSHGGAHKLKLETNKEVYLNVLDQFTKAAEEFDLRIMLLLPRPFTDPNIYNEQRELIIEILDRFKETPTIFSYDFFNEPGRTFHL